MWAILQQLRATFVHYQNNANIILRNRSNIGTELRSYLIKKKQHKSSSRYYYAENLCCRYCSSKLLFCASVQRIDFFYCLIHLSDNVVCE